jgi:hypothetical protein
MSRPFQTFTSLFVTVMTLQSCGLIPNLGCDITMNEDYIESTCGLHSGVRFEQLQVDTFYQDKTPKKFRVVLSFEGHLKDSIYKTQIDRIYFNRPTGMYVWWTDTTTNALYHKWGIHKERIDIAEIPQDTTKETVVQITHDSIVTTGPKPSINFEKYKSERHLTCPIKFRPDTWYYITFFDQRYEAYLYVDKDMNYKVDKISLPTNF